MYQNAVYICISWYSKICLFPVKKCWFQQNSKGAPLDSNICWIFFRLGVTVPIFIILGNVWQILGRGAFCPPHPLPIREQLRKSPSWIWLSVDLETALSKFIWLIVSKSNTFLSVNRKSTISYNVLNSSCRLSAFTARFEESLCQI